jgi:hypothetical protein
MSDPVIVEIKEAVFKLAEFCSGDSCNRINYVKFEYTDDGINVCIRSQKEKDLLEGERLTKLEECLKKDGFKPSTVGWTYPYPNNQDKAVVLVFSMTLLIRPDTPGRLMRVHKQVFDKAADGNVSSAFKKNNEMLARQFPPEVCEQMVDNIMERHGYVRKGTVASKDLT